MRTGRHRATGMAAVGAALVLTLTACGGTTGTPTGPSDPGTPAVSTTAGSGATATSSTAPLAGSSTSAESSTSAGSSTSAESSTARPTPTGGIGPSDQPDSASGDAAVTDEAPDTTGGGSDVTGDGPDVVSSVTPAPFDAQTTAWFAVMCTSLSSVTDIDVPTYPYATDGGTEPPLEQTRTEALADYAALQSTFTAAAESLDGTAPPTLEGGTEMASDVLASLRAMAAVAADAPDVLGSARTSTDLETAMDDLHDRMREAEDLVPDDSPLVSDEVTAAMAQMPECQPLLG